MITPETILLSLRAGLFLGFCWYLFVLNARLGGNPRSRRLRGVSSSFVASFLFMDGDMIYGRTSFLLGGNTSTPLNIVFIGFLTIVSALFIVVAIRGLRKIDHE